MQSQFDFAHYVLMAAAIALLTALVGQLIFRKLAPSFAERGYAVIEVRDIWKKFRRPHIRVTSVKEAVVRFLRGQTGYDDFWAVKGVSFKVAPGEAVGLIGPNGSGKSTLFAMIARVLEPTHGTVNVDGRVCPLLELGTGFHPELSGRDNVYLNGSLLGLYHADVAARYQSIVDFAELPEVMDAPVKTYSTGMIVRLGFSVAVHVDPDVLLVDEVLSVGDEHFQHKSFRRMQQFKDPGQDHLRGLPRSCRHDAGHVRADHLDRIRRNARWTGTPRKSSPPTVKPSRRQNAARERLPMLAPAELLRAPRATSSSPRSTSPPSPTPLPGARPPWSAPATARR